METPERRPEDCKSRISLPDRSLICILVIEVKLNNQSPNHEPINDNQSGCRC